MARPRLITIAATSRRWRSSPIVATSQDREAGERSRPLQQSHACCLLVLSYSDEPDRSLLQSAHAGQDGSPVAPTNLRRAASTRGADVPRATVHFARLSASITDSAATNCAGRSVAARMSAPCCRRKSRW